jgi:hypothetical protein
MDLEPRPASLSRPSDPARRRLIRLSKRRSVQRCRRILDRCLELTPAEIVHRVGALLGRHGAGARRLAPDAPVTPTTPADARAALDARFILDREAAASTVTAFAASAATAARIRAETRVLLSAGAGVFGRIVPLDPDGLDWRADPTTGRRFWPDLPLDEAGAVRATRDHDGTALADVKYTWELSRHQMLLPLALAHRIDGDAAAAGRLAALVDGWIAQNPVGAGVHWSSALEVGVRILSWLWTMRFVLESPSLPAGHAARWVRSLGEHYDFLRRHLSIYTDRSNHLIGEATALWVSASVLRDLPDANAERARALEILGVEIERQVTPDGVSREQAVGYHCFVLDFCLQIIALARHQQAPLPPVIEARAGAMLEFLHRLLGAGGPLPQIGDGDDGQGLPFPCPLTARERAETQLAIGAALFTRPEWLPRGEVPRTLARLLVADPPPPPPGPTARRARSRLFADGGYAVLEGRTNAGGARQLVFDVGGMGYLPGAAHEHADALSVVVRVNDTLLVADPGTGTYTGSRAVRDGFRATAAHNTVTVDDLDQADVLDTFKWINLPRARVLDWQSDEAFDQVAAAHDGYRRLRRPVVHAREVLFARPDYWIVADRLVGRGAHRITSRLHFPPGVELTRRGARRFEAVAPAGNGPGDGLLIMFLPIVPELADTIRIEPAAWSAGYGRWESSRCLTVDAVGEVPRTLLTLLIPSEHGHSRVEVGSEPEDGEAPMGVGDVVLCRIKSADAAGREDRVIRRRSANGPRVRDEIVFVRHEGGQEIVRPFGLHGIDG